MGTVFNKKDKNRESAGDFLVLSQIIDNNEKIKRLCVIPF